MSTHVYQALEGREYLRLIVLHPALSKDAPLRINFLASTIEDLQGRYDAVSYTWGEPILTFALHVDDGTQVCVTKNLDNALRYLRYKDCDRLLWADAASINQSDNEEKAVQIPFMVDIFRGARRVMAWLDPGRDTTVEQRGMKAIDRISRTDRRVSQPPPEYSHEMLQFLNLPWFNRLWIVQEIVFSLEIYLICGETELPFSRLVAALFIMQYSHVLEVPDYEVKVNAILEIGRLWDRYSLSGNRFDSSLRANEYYDLPGHDTNIVSLVERFGLYGCTDPRDRIFALFSMATNVRRIAHSSESDDKSSSCGWEDSPLFKTNMDGSQHSDPISINIDYSLDVMETYETFALACLLKPALNWDIWRAVFSRQHLPRPIGWPSWVPDWRVKPQLAVIKHHESMHHLLRIRRVAMGVLRLTFLVTRYFLDGKENQLYTVKYKTSNEAKNSGVSFESQLLRLYKMLQKPEIVQASHRLLVQSRSTRRKLEPMDFPNLLVEMIRCRASLYDRISDSVDLFLELDRYLARMSMASAVDDPHNSPRSSSVRVRDLINDLDRSLGNMHSLFCFHDPITKVNSAGYGSVALEPGDQLLPLGVTVDFPYTGEIGTYTVFILPRDHAAVEQDGKERVYRLVGIGYIFDPAIVLMSMEFKRHLKEISETEPRASHPKSYERIYTDKKHFLNPFGCKEVEQVIYLV